MEIGVLGMAFQRSPETERAYQIEAHRHLRRAHKCHPNAALLEGLVLSVTDDPTIIKSATARLYKQELIAAVDILVSRGRLSHRPGPTQSSRSAQRWPPGAASPTSREQPVARSRTRQRPKRSPSSAISPRELVVGGISIRSACWRSMSMSSPGLAAALSSG